MGKRKGEKMSSETAPAAPEPEIGIKGFDRDLKCRDYQFEVGRTERGTGDVVRCGSGGFHSVDMPLDAWTYYPPGDSRYCEVARGGQIARGDEGDDSKVASAEIMIRAELRLPDVIGRAVDWIIARAAGNTATGDSGHAAATGEHGIAAALGPNSTAQCGTGWIVLAAWRWAGDRYELLHVRSARAGGPEGVQAGITYRLTEAGEFEAIKA